MLINATKYAIRATLYLGAYSSLKHKIAAKKIAEDINVPLPFLAKLLQQLSKNRIISSTKGPQGGFYLNEANYKKSIWDVISCIEGDEKFDDCYLGLDECSNANPCSMHTLVVSFRNGLKKEFKEKDIAQLVNEMTDEEGNVLLRV